jgi:putative hydroxymethylpyrimidine transport system permease protein
MRARDILIAVLVALALWQTIVVLTDAPHFILPSPWRVAQAAFHSRAIIAENAWVTIIEVLLGLTLGTVLGAATAIHLALSKTAERCIGPVADALVWLWHGVKDRDDGDYHLFPRGIGIPRWPDAH